MSQLVWMEAETHRPPEDALLLVIELKGSQLRIATMAAGFYSDGEYFVGNTGAGDPIPPDQQVIYWALPVWPSGYDQYGCWRS